MKTIWNVTHTKNWKKKSTKVAVSLFCFVLFVEKMRFFLRWLHFFFTVFDKPRWTMKYTNLHRAFIGCSIFVLTAKCQFFFLLRIDMSFDFSFVHQWVLRFVSIVRHFSDFDVINDSCSVWHAHIKMSIPNSSEENKRITPMKSWQPHCSSSSHLSLYWIFIFGSPVERFFCVFKCLVN